MKHQDLVVERKIKVKQAKEEVAEKDLAEEVVAEKDLAKEDIK